MTLTTEESTSILAHNVFMRGQHHADLAEYFEKHDITCPEELFKVLRKCLVKGVSELNGTKYDKKAIGDYQFSNIELTLPELVKKIWFWRWQSGDCEKTTKGKLFKLMGQFASDCCVKYMKECEEYKKADWS